MDIIDVTESIKKDIINGRIAIARLEFSDGTKIQLNEVPYLEHCIKASEEMLSWGEPFSHDEWSSYLDKDAPDV